MTSYYNPRIENHIQSVKTNIVAASLDLDETKCKMIESHKFISRLEHFHLNQLTRCGRLVNERKKITMKLFPEIFVDSPHFGRSLTDGEKINWSYFMFEEDCIRLERIELV